MPPPRPKPHTAATGAVTGTPAAAAAAVSAVQPGIEDVPDALVPLRARSAAQADTTMPKPSWPSTGVIPTAFSPHEANVDRVAPSCHMSTSLAQARLVHSKLASRRVLM